MRCVTGYFIDAERGSAETRTVPFTVKDIADLIGTDYFGVSPRRVGDVRVCILLRSYETYERMVREGRDPNITVISDGRKPLFDGNIFVLGADGNRFRSLDEHEVEVLERNTCMVQIKGTERRRAYVTMALTNVSVPDPVPGPCGGDLNE